LRLSGERRRRKAQAVSTSATPSSYPHACGEQPSVNVGRAHGVGHHEMANQEGCATAALAHILSVDARLV
ncbi:MAG: hypothetical protein WD969_12445, partial [Paracoccaceae bacterium]